MCGIVGRCSVPGNPPSLESVRGATELLHHRGPDDLGIWSSADGQVILGHRRLAILELSPAGHQPMLSNDGSLCIVFNGEIYNHQELRRELAYKGHAFRSHSDTEVILAAYREWGGDCLSRLNGMFAFALYDARQRLLFLARDRAGEKPLFYQVAGGQLAFASETKALMADPAFERRLDQEAFGCYLAFGFAPGDRCILQGVRKLPPAHALAYKVDTAEVKIWDYWRLPPQEPGVLSEADLVGQLEYLLEDSVRKQLAADVPVGVLLSGGVDSSLTTAMAVRANRNVKTFTIRFPGYGAYDETEHARLIANHFGTEHIELEAEKTTVDLLPMLARQFDEPMVDSSMIPTYLLSKLVRQHCTVALGGDGGDELFGGYSHYNRLLWLQANPGRIPHPLRRQLALLAGLLPLGFKGRNWLQGLGANLQSGVPLIASYFDARSRAALLRPDIAAAMEKVKSPESIWLSRMPRSGDLLQRATRMDFDNFLAEDILVKVDRASMLNSLEVRAPWLDYRLIEFAFSRLPSALKASPHSRKILPKLLASRLLPPAFDLERKQGFSIPLAAWLRGEEWGGFFRDVLLGSGDGLFNKKFIGHLLDGQRQGRANSERLFALVLFELWRREYDIVI
jgi:asparagine synthase (glutamine-hydrolysing)